MSRNPLPLRVIGWRGGWHCGHFGPNVCHQSAQFIPRGRKVLGGTVNKTDLINQLALRLDGDKKAAQTAVEGFIDLVQREVQRGENVSISGFGVFEKRARAARTARNPRTGTAVKVKKTTVPAFRPGKYFKDVIAGTVKLPKVTAKPTTARAAARRPRLRPPRRRRREEPQPRRPRPLRAPGRPQQNRPRLPRPRPSLRPGPGPPRPSRPRLPQPPRRPRHLARRPRPRPPRPGQRAPRRRRPPRRPPPGRLRPKRSNGHRPAPVTPLFAHRPADG